MSGHRRHGGAARRARGRRVPAPAAQQLLRHRARSQRWRRPTRSWTARAGAGPSCWRPKAGTSAPGLDFAANAGQDIAELYRAALRLFAAPLPVVAAVQGAAIGGGCGLALSADFRVATRGSRFSANFARLGFHHGFALTVTLPATVGRQAAADLLLTGRRVGGERGAGPRPLRPAGTRRRGRTAGHGARLRRGAGRRRPAGGPRHPGHAAPRPGGGGPFGHGARVRRAAAPAPQRRLCRGRAGRGRAPRPPVQRVMRHRRAGALHDAEHRLQWADHPGPFRAVTAEQARQYDEQGFFVLEDALGADEVDGPDRGDRPLRGARRRRRCARWRAVVSSSPAPTRSPSRPTWCCARGCCAASHRRRCSPTCAPTSSAPTSGCTGTRRCTRSRAPSPRSRGTRTTGTPSSSRSST